MGPCFQKKKDELEKYYAAEFSVWKVQVDSDTDSETALIMEQMFFGILPFCVFWKGLGCQEACMKSMVAKLTASTV